MNQKSIFAQTHALYAFSIIATIVALAIIFNLFLNNFVYATQMLIFYILLFSLIITLCISFNKGVKEAFKASAAALITMCLVFHILGFTEVILPNYSYFLNGNILIKAIGIIAILLFVLFVIAYINHFIINCSNNSNSNLVNKNKNLLIIIGVLSLIQTAFVVLYDIKISIPIEIHSILTNIMYFFLSMIIISVETLINIFRTARENGDLSKVASKIVGDKAAKKAGAK